MILGCSQTVILLHTSPTYTVSTLIKAMAIKFIVSPFTCGVDAGGRPGAASLIFIMMFHYCNIN